MKGMDDIRQDREQANHTVGSERKGDPRLTAAVGG
jgi:hypothetical protein